MANILAIHSVGNSLVTSLRNAYPEELREEHACQFLLLSSGQLAQDTDFAPALTLYLYRVTVNEHLRNQATPRDPHATPTPLSLNLHYLLTVWCEGAEAEHTIFAWAMRQLHLNPVLDVSSLSPEAEWRRDEIIQLVPAEITNEDLMRVWDAMAPSYRLSFSYIARLARIEVTETEHLPAVARRVKLRALEEGTA